MEPTGPQRETWRLGGPVKGAETERAQGRDGVCRLLGVFGESVHSAGCGSG